MVALLDSRSAVKLSFDRDNGISLADYHAFCRAHPELRIERTAQGEIIYTPPAGFESSHRNSSVTAQLHAIWHGLG